MAGPQAMCKHGINPSWCSDCIYEERRREARRTGQPVPPITVVELEDIERPRRRTQQRFVPPDDEDGWRDPAEAAFDPSPKKEEGDLDVEPQDDGEEDKWTPPRFSDDGGRGTPVAKKPPLRAPSPVESGNGIREEDPNLPPRLTPAERKEKERLQNLPMCMVLEIPVERVHPYTGQPRKHFDGRQLANLGRSIKRRGQRTPASVRWLPDDNHYFCELIDGERRLRAIQREKLPTLRAVREEVGSEIEQFRNSVISNFGRLGHTPLEIATALERIAQETEDTQAEIAADLGKSQTWVSQHLSLTKLSATVRAMMSVDLPDKQRIKFSLALVLAGLPQHLQERLAREVIQGEISVTVAMQYVRRRAREEGIRPDRKGRTPHRDRETVLKTIGILVQRLELLEDMTPEQIIAMFATRTPEDQEAVVRRLEEIATRAEAITGKFSPARELIHNPGA